MKNMNPHQSSIFMEEYYDKLLALLLSSDLDNIDLARFIISQIPTKRKKKEMCDRLVEGYLNSFEFDKHEFQGGCFWRINIPSYFGYYQITNLTILDRHSICLHDYDVENDLIYFNVTFMKLSRFLNCYKPKQEQK